MLNFLRHSKGDEGQIDDWNCFDHPSLLYVVPQEVPNFLEDKYHRVATAAFQHVRGSSLNNLLSCRAFDELFQSVFEDHLASRSEKLVEDMQGYMQKVLGKLFEHSCEGYPALLKALKTNLVEDFMEVREAKAKEAAQNIVGAELNRVHPELLVRRNPGRGGDRLTQEQGKGLTYGSGKGRRRS